MNKCFIRREKLLISLKETNSLAKYCAYAYGKNLSTLDSLKESFGIFSVNFFVIVTIINMLPIVDCSINILNFKKEYFVFKKADVLTANLKIANIKVVWFAFSKLLSKYLCNVSTILFKCLNNNVCVNHY